MKEDEKLHGLKEGFVKLENSDNRNRKSTDIRRKKIKKLLGEEAVEIVHVGSTALRATKARPIADLMIALTPDTDLEKTAKKLENTGFSTSKSPLKGNCLYLSCVELGLITCCVFLVTYKSTEYWALINFRDYLNANALRKKEYEDLKANLALKYADDPISYSEGKAAFTEKLTEEARIWRIFSRSVTVTVTSPMGTVLPNGKVYRLNHGQADNMDGDAMKPEEICIIGENKPVKRFSGRVIAVLQHREENGTSKEFWITAPPGKSYIKPEIQSAFENDTGISCRYICLYEKSCGAVVYFIKDGEPLYLLIKNRSQNMGFPKGHVEMDEDEHQTAMREIFEETNLHVTFEEDFREYYSYTINFCRKKQAVYFLAHATDGKIIIPRNEILSYSIVSFRNALRILSHGNEKKVLRDAHTYLKQKLEETSRSSDDGKAL